MKKSLRKQPSDCAIVAMALMVFAAVGITTMVTLASALVAQDSDYDLALRKQRGCELSCLAGRWLCICKNRVPKQPHAAAPEERCSGQRTQCGLCQSVCIDGEWACKPCLVHYCEYRACPRTTRGNEVCETPSQIVDCRSPLCNQTMPDSYQSRCIPK